MRAHGIQVYPEVFKKADLMKVLPDGIAEELKKSTNLDFEADRYDEIRDVVTNIVHNHMNTTTLRDVEKRLMAISGGDHAGSHDHTDVEDYTAQAAPQEEYNEELQVHYVGKRC